jgi:hypothetical protein
VLLPLAASTLLLVAQPCPSDSACAPAGLCTAPPSAATLTCHARCEPGCQPGERCTVLRPPDDERWPRHRRRYVCTREPSRLCEPCQRDEDCGALLDRCLDLASGERVCGRDCSWGDDCPRGYVCADPGASDGRPARRQCIPQAACCACDQGFYVPYERATLAPQQAAPEPPPGADVADAPATWPSEGFAPRPSGPTPGSWWSGTPGGGSSGSGSPSSTPAASTPLRAPTPGGGTIRTPGYEPRPVMPTAATSSAPAPAPPTRPSPPAPPSGSPPPQPRGRGVVLQ